MYHITGKDIAYCGICSKWSACRQERSVIKTCRAVHLDSEKVAAETFRVGTKAGEMCLMWCMCGTREDAATVKVISSIVKRVSRDTVRARLLRHGGVQRTRLVISFQTDIRSEGMSERETAWKTKYDHTRGTGGGFRGRKWDYRGRLVAARTTVDSSASIVPTGFASTARVGLSAWTACGFLSRCTTESTKPQFRMRKRGVSQLQKNICIMQMEGSQSTPTGFEPHHARIWSRPSPSCLKDKQNYHFMSKMAFSLCRKQASSGVDSQVTTRLPSLSLLR